MSTQLNWKEHSLYDFVSRNTPKTWESFFKENIDLLISISHTLCTVEKEIYPSIEDVFRCFIPLENIKLVILGMDPYHDGSASGYCFSSKTNKIPPSLRNIYNEIENSDYKINEKNGDITHWATQGCFMLNASLTVEKSSAGCHLKLWKPFTQKVISYIKNNTKNVGWLLMGNSAIELYESSPSTNKTHVLFKTSHPSPLGAMKASKYAEAFIGSKVFAKINEFLLSIDKETINW